jgi:hypothetical protein
LHVDCRADTDPRYVGICLEADGGGHR